jgi:hypothetical protein
MPNDSYKLINPYIEGSLKTTVSGKTQLEAAKSAWNKLSKNFTNNIPKFAFTLKNVSDGKLCHFLVKEKTSNDTVNYTITELDISSSDKGVKDLKNKIKNLKQSGGKAKRRRKRSKHDDDDDDSSSDSDTDDLYNKIKYNNLLNKMYPITYWWYDPIAYARYIDTFYAPNFVAPLSPYVEIQVAK